MHRHSDHTASCTKTEHIGQCTETEHIGPCTKTEHIGPCTETEHGGQAIRIAPLSQNGSCYSQPKIATSQIKYKSYKLCEPPRSGLRSVFRIALNVAKRMRLPRSSKSYILHQILPAKALTTVQFRKRETCHVWFKKCIGAILTKMAIWKKGNYLL